MKKNRNILIFLVISMFLFTGCTKDEYSKAEYDKINNKAKYIIAGRVAPIANADISSKISGIVEKAFVKEGSFVKANTPLLKLEDKELNAKLNQANAGVALAQANYDNIKKGARDEEKIKAIAALNSAKKAKKIATVNYDRDKELYESGAISKQELEKSELKLQEALSQESSFQAQLDLINKGATEENLKVLQSQINQAQAIVEGVKVQIDNTIITAPYDCVISNKYVEVGELVSTGMKVYTIQGTGGLKVEGRLPESLFNKVKEGDKVVVKIPDYSKKEYKGELVLVSPSIDESGEGLKVEVVLTEVDKNIKPGSFAEIGLKK
ncbi:HlyD family secretion protein [Tepidibacter aestuarii]|uniref:HlyD family secretion protein n=1 Tax=Tepidibacter aestuarii TaxID=2925782 RepID=UPI0020BDA066|nr:HlyD family efflux transporter periplasmic adaptor subunit [Tepidibacter aestuarii]CAH2213547.1 exported protein of unknown function [Tepidibacter aestuarii]